MSKIKDVVIDEMNALRELEYETYGAPVGNECPAGVNGDEQNEAFSKNPARVRLAGWCQNNISQSD